VAKQAIAYTLWTKPMSDWTRVLEGLEFTETVRQEIEKAIELLDDAELDERLKPYDTPVTQET
jgi:hypothetical protein